MTESTVLLLTSHYPYASGEEFIEAEIEHLASRFSRVLVAPLSYRPGMQQTRPLPANASTVLPSPGTRSASDVRDLARFILLHPLRTARSATRALRTGGIRHYLADLRFDLHASLLAESLLPDLRARLTDYGPLVLYSYWFHTQARVALELRERLGDPRVPWVSRGHRGDIYSDIEGHLPQRGLMVSGVDRLCTVSQSGADALLQQFPMLTGRLVVRRLGVTAADNPGNATRTPFTVVSCSWIKPVKRVELLVAGLAEAQRLGVPVRWNHIGSGSEPDVSALRTLAASSLKPDTFHFEGALPNSRVREWYASHPASAFVNVSSSEGAPVSIMEALAQGLPIIATDVGGSAELLDPSRGMFDGLLRADPSAAEIAEAFVRLHGATLAEYDAYVHGSLSHWEQSWSSATNYDAFAAELSDLAARRTPQREEEVS